MENPVVFLNRLGKFAFMPIGLLLVLAAVWAGWSTKAWVARSVEVQGLVIEMVRVRDREDSGYLFAPVVRFKTVNGSTIEFESGLRTNPPAYHTGQIVSVLYDPDEPRSAAIHGMLSLWMMPIILSFIGTIFLIVGTAMVVMSGRVARIFDMPASPDGLTTRSASASR